MPCRCESDLAGCKCTFTGGLGVELSGSGTVGDPLQVHVLPAFLTAVNGTNTVVTVGGVGDVPDPYLLRIELTTGLFDSTWDRWEGDEGDLLTRPPLARQLAIVRTPVPRLVGLTNLFAGAQRIVRLYVGDQMVADDLGGVLGPGI